MKAFIDRFERLSKDDVFHVSLEGRRPSRSFMLALAGEAYAAKPYASGKAVAAGSIIDVGKATWRSPTSVAIQVKENPDSMDSSACTIVVSKLNGGWVVDEVAHCWIG